MSRLLVFSVVLAGACRPANEPESAAAPAVTPAGPAESPPAGAASAPGFTPTEIQAEMIRRLSLRDGMPPCADVEAGSTDPVGDLRAIVTHVDMPPFAPMRAAECLITAHADAAEPDVIGWMAAPNQAGLAILVANRLEQLPRPLALSAARAGLGGPHADEVRKRILAAKDPEVRAWADTINPPPVPTDAPAVEEAPRAP